MSTRIVKRATACFMAVFMLITSIIPMYALSYDVEAAKAAAKEDCRTWRQSDERWSNYPIGRSGSTIGGIGCYLTASLVAIKMAGNASPDSQPLEFVEWLNANGGFGPAGDLYWQPVYTYVRQCAGSEVQILYRDISEGIFSSVIAGKTTWKDKINALSSAGYYCLVHFSRGHYVLATGQDENGDVLIFDAAGIADLSAAAAPSRKTAYVLTEQYSYGEIDGVTILDMSGTPLNECKEFGGGSTESSNGFTVSDIRNQYGEEYWVSEQGLNEFTSINLMNGNALTMSEREEVGDWRQTLEYKDDSEKHGILRAIVMLIGIIMILYSTLIFVAFQVDRINNFVDVPLLYFLTAGKMMTVNEDEQSTYNEDNKGAKMMKQKDICIASLVGIVVGILLLSGKLYELINLALSLVAKLINKI